MEKPQTDSQQRGLSIDERVAVSLAVQRYLRALAKFEEASNDFNTACTGMRSVLKEKGRFACNVNHEMHLISFDGEGNFNVETVDLI